MPLNDTALLEIKEFLSITGRDINEQNIDTAKYEMHINAASLAIKRYLCRQVTPIASGTSEYFTGDDSNEYYVQGLNISSVSAIYYWAGTKWTEMTTALYPYSPVSEERLIYFTEGATFWRPSSNYGRNFKLVYTHGYKRLNVPADIKLACAKLVQRALLQAEGKEGIQSESFGDVTTSYDWSGWPSSVKALLQPYKRTAFGR